MQQNYIRYHIGANYCLKITFFGNILKTSAIISLHIHRNFFQLISKVFLTLLHEYLQNLYRSLEAIFRKFIFNEIRRIKNSEKKNKIETA